uniref:Uncharacterized protein n=1 Tax=Ascaris lumbricoides TaxID=6252 RepID=A0A9J2PAI0_ASCLU
MIVASAQSTRFAPQLESSNATVCWFRETLRRSSKQRLIMVSKAGVMIRTVPLAVLNCSFVLRHILPSLAPILREKYETELLDITVWTQEVGFPPNSEISLTVMPFCTLVALSPYRRAVMELVHCQRRVQPVRTRSAMETVNGG